MACLGMIEATVTRDGKTTTQRRYYVSSRLLTAEAYLAAARSHWVIEIGLRWVAGRHLRRGSRPQPQGPWAGKPRDLTQARPQTAQAQAVRLL